MPAKLVARISGHSTRVGATQDLAILDIDLVAITQAGGWKSTRMLLQYAEKINAARSGMARPVAPERKADVMLEHFQWLVRLEKEGHILVTGGIFMRDGTQSEGLTILRAADWDAAEALAASDPLILAGANSYHIERFRLGAGRITVSVDFSHQSMRLGCSGRHRVHPLPGHGGVSSPRRSESLNAHCLERSAAGRRCMMQ
jgi:uncharacterized protein YciI